MRRNPLLVTEHHKKLRILTRGCLPDPAERYQCCVGINRYHIVFKMKFKMVTLTTLSLFASLGVYRRTLGKSIIIWVWHFAEPCTEGVFEHGNWLLLTSSDT